MSRFRARRGPRSRSPADYRRRRAGRADLSALPGETSSVGHAVDGTRAGVGYTGFSVGGTFQGVPRRGMRNRSRPMGPAVFQARPSRKPSRSMTGFVLEVSAGLKLSVMNG